MKKKFNEFTLEVLFDSPVRARILKMFLYAPERDFGIKIISKILNVKTALINKHLKTLSEIKFLKTKTIGGKKFFRVNSGFNSYNELKELILRINPASKEKIIRQIISLGKIKLAVISGVFMNFENARADLMVVGDKIKLNKFNKFLRNLEAETGKEINYALMTAEEFQYRYGMYDRFIRDLLEFKHEKLINKLKI